MSISLQKESESGSKKQSHPNGLSKNRRMGDIRWGKRAEKEGQLVKVVQNPSFEAPPRGKRE